MSVKFEKIALIGLGLIASSIALAARKAGLAAHIQGTDLCEDIRREARALEICDVVESNIEAVKGADLVILAIPIRAMKDVVKEIAPHMKSGALLTDTGSVKAHIVTSIRAHVPSGVHFLPGHPIAGTEHSGPAAGFAELFENRWTILTPDAKTPESCLKELTAFWEALGSQVEVMSPKHHDLVLAVTSHAPHLIAYTMVGVADDLEKIEAEEVITYSAAGFRDFTRIAASDPTMWRDVFLTNKEATIEVLGRFVEELMNLQKAIRNEDGELLFRHFERTRNIRRGIIDAGQDTEKPDFGRGHSGDIKRG